MEHTQSWIDFVELIAKNEMVRSDGEIRKWITLVENISKGGV